MDITIKKSGKGAHCASFTHLGESVEIFTLNGEEVARNLAIKRMGMDKKEVYIKPFLQVSDILNFGRILEQRRAKNKIASKSRVFNHGRNKQK